VETSIKERSGSEEASSSHVLLLIEHCEISVCSDLYVKRFAQDLSEPTYTEASLVGETQPVSSFGYRNWAKLEVWFVLGRFLFSNSSNGGVPSTREEWNSLPTNTWSELYSHLAPLKKGLVKRI